MDIELTDVTLHIDQNLSTEQRGTIEAGLLALDGVVCVHNADKTPHLMMVEYDPDSITSRKILEHVTGRDIQAELVGL